MVMDRIGGIGNRSRELLDRFQGSGRTEAKKERGLPAPGSAAGEHRAAPADTAAISPKAHRLIALHHAMEQGRAALESVPEVREDRVAEARARLNRGFYNSIEVRSRVAEKLDGVSRTLEDL